MGNWLLYTRIALLLAAMTYASYRDWRYREVDDWLWLASGSLGALLTAFDLWLTWGYHKLLLTVFSIGLSSGLAFVFYFLGLYGGADAKAVAVISVSLPLYRGSLGFHPFTGLAALTNGLILSLTLPLTLFIYNVFQVLRGERLFQGFEHESNVRKVAAFFFGVRLKDARMRKFWFPMEEERNGVRRFRFSFLSLELEELRKDDLWATPGIPLLIFIALGFAVFLLIGDISYLAFKYLGIFSA